MFYRHVFINGNDPERKNRLARVVDAMPENVRSRLKSIYDHRGMLTVRWFHYMYETELAIIIEQIWRNENECLIAHVDEKSDINHHTFPYNQFEPYRPI